MTPEDFKTRRIDEFPAHGISKKRATLADADA